MGEAITEFRSELLAQIKNEAMANNEFDQIQFLISVTSELEIFEICPVATPCFFERIGKRNRKLWKDKKKYCKKCISNIY